MGKGEWGGGQDADQGVQTCALGSAHHTPLVQDGIGIPPPPRPACTLVRPVRSRSHTLIHNH